MSVCNLVDDPLPVIVVLVVMFLIFVFDWTYMSVPKASDLPMLARYFVGSVIDLSSLLTVAILTLPYLLFFDRSHAKEPDHPSLPLVILVHGTNASPLEYLAVQWYLRVRRIPHYSASLIPAIVSSNSVDTNSCQTTRSCVIPRLGTSALAAVKCSHQQGLSPQTAFEQYTKTCG